MIDIRDLEAFVAILDSGSISKAAESLALTQPALSLKLKKMEAELGVKLFQRTPRSMVPLDAARALEAKVRSIITQFDGLSDALASSMSELKGSVRIGCLMGWFQTLLTPSVERIYAQAPGMRLKLHVDDTEKLIYAVSHGRLDFAVVAQPFENVDGLHTEHLFDEDLVLFGRNVPRLGAKGDEAARRRDLLARPWVTMANPDPIVEKYWREQFNGRTFPWDKVAVPVTTDHIASLPRLVSAIPQALCVAPRQIVLKASERGYLEIADSVPHRNSVSLVWRGESLSVQRYALVHATIVAQAAAFASVYGTLSQPRETPLTP